MYSFLDEVPAGFKINFDSGIFHDPSHLKLQSPAGWHSFSVVDKKEQTVVAVVSFHVAGIRAVSPYRSPYGSFVFSEILSKETLIEFIHFTEQKLHDSGVKFISLKNPPEAYAALQQELLNSVLLENGYDIAQEEASAIIPVSEVAFESGLHRSAKKKLRKCREAGLVFQQLPVENLAVIYSLLKHWREKKNYSLSMSLSSLKEVVDAFPEQFLFTVVKDQDQLVAANISIQVTKQVLYNFYHDHASSYDSLSPVVLLNEGLYEFCQKNDIAMLDLGTSTVNGKINESLLNFKVRLGAQSSRKLTFIKNLL